MQCYFLLLCFVFLPSLALADSPWIGKMVFIKHHVKGKVGNKVVDPGGSPTTVTQVNGDWLWVGKSWVATKDVLTVDQALVYYTNEIKTNPHMLDWVLRACAWHEKGEYDNAIKDYTEAIRLDPKDAVAYFNRGCSWRAKGEYNNAIKDFTEAIRLNPKDAKAYNNRGSSRSDLGDYDNAIKDFTEAIRLNPSYSFAYNHRGNAWSNKHDIDKANRDYNEAIRLDPTNASAYYNRGRISHENGEYDKALNDYAESIRLDPSYSHPYNNRAWLRATCPDARYRNGAQAVQDALKACELTKWSNAIIVGTLGEAYAEAGDFKSATKWQKKAIELDIKNKMPGKYERLKLYESGQPYREPAVKK